MRLSSCTFEPWSILQRADSQYVVAAELQWICAVFSECLCGLQREGLPVVAWVRQLSDSGVRASSALPELSTRRSIYKRFQFPINCTRLPQGQPSAICYPCHSMPPRPTGFSKYISIYITLYYIYTCTIYYSSLKSVCYRFYLFSFPIQFSCLPKAFCFCSGLSCKGSRPDMHR